MLSDYSVSVRIHSASMLYWRFGKRNGRKRLSSLRVIALVKTIMLLGIDQ